MWLNPVLIRSSLETDKHVFKKQEKLFLEAMKMTAYLVTFKEVIQLYHELK
jgi:hypothetical protein